MQKAQLFALLSVVGSAWLLSSCTTTSPTSAAAETPRITVLYDAFGKDAAMTKDWGYAALVEINSKRILFDTGNDAALPAEMRYYDGTPPEILKLGTVFTGANIQLIDKTTELTPGITLIALVSNVPGTKELKELSLAINTADGLVLVVGCSHPGIQGFVAEAAKINPHIHFLAGGFHLVAAEDPAIEKIVTTLHDTFRVDYIAPGHCTGEPAFAALQKTFGRHYLYAGLGTTLDLGATPRAAADRRASGVLDEGDLRIYRTLLAQSDDLSEGGPEIVHLAQIK